MRHLLFGMVFLLLLVGCSSKGDSVNDNGYADTIVTTFVIDKCNLRYDLPYPRNSIVAPHDRLTDKMSMCIVDTLTNVSVLLLNFPDTPKDYQEAEKIVNLISGQNPIGYIASTTHQINKSTFLDMPAWKFEVSLLLKNVSDSIPVTFCGYIFENMGFVVTVPSDSVSNDFVSPYINGLKKVREIN